MNALRRWWPDVVLVIGIAWLSFACSAYAGDGALDGQLDDDGGDVSGDFSVGYTPIERANIAAAAALTSIGALGKINQRRPRSSEPRHDESPRADG